MVGVLENSFEYIQEDSRLKAILDGIRKEIADAIYNARLNNAFDKDVNLSFGVVHINPYGSASAISFHGKEVRDTDKFIVTTALSISEKSYFDIRKYIVNNVGEFSFYPIEVDGKIELTVYKYSSYFHKKYGFELHDHSKFRALYAYKYIVFIINEGGENKVEVYNIGCLSPYPLAVNLIKYVYNNGGCNSHLFYCFGKTADELLKIGVKKKDFYNYRPRCGIELFDFYEGELKRLIFKISIVRDGNKKIKVKETCKRAISLMTDLYSGGKGQFCKDNNLGLSSFNHYLSSSSYKMEYLNGDEVTLSRLLELLGVDFDVSAEGLLNKNILHEISYDAIPDGY